MKANSSTLNAAILILGAILAGCLGGGKEPPPGTGADPGRGGLSGRVLEPGGLPLAGALVRVLLQDLEAVTDEAGGYRIADVPAGSARVLASAAGHASAVRDVTIRSDADHALDFVLRPIAAPQPDIRTTSFSGKIACGLPQGVNCGQALPEEDSSFHFAVDSGLQALLIEVVWQGTLPGSAQGLHVDLRAATPTACGLKYQEVQGASVLRLEAREGFPTRGGHQCAVIRATSDQVAVDQEFTLHATRFLYQDIPPGFTALAS